MKTHYNLYVIILCCLLVLFSCSSESDSSSNEESVNQTDDEINQVTDDFFYVVLRRTGESGQTGVLYQVGNNTGESNGIGSIRGLGFNIVFNAIAINSSKVFIYEQNFDPLEGYIHVYDISNEMVEKNTIQFPNDIFGDFPAITAMDWDYTNNKLIAIVNSESGSQFGFSYLAEIDPETFQIQSLDIELGQFFVTTSTTIKNSKLYASLVEPNFINNFQDFVEIDLINKTHQSLNLTGLEGALLQISGNDLNNVVFGYSKVFNTGRGNATEPFVVNLDTGEYQGLLPNLPIVTFNNGVKTYYHKTQNTLVSLTGADGKDYILEYDVQSQNVKLIEIQDFGVLQGGAIIAVRTY